MLSQAQVKCLLTALDDDVADLRVVREEGEVEAAGQLEQHA